MKTRTERIILWLSLLGLVLSAYAVTLHFAPSSSSWCTLGPALNCDKVNKSPWAVFLGIPVAILGALSYLTAFLLELKRTAVMRSLSFSKADFYQYYLLLIFGMLCFQLYLTLIEIFRIRAYCIVCLASQAILLVIAALVWREYTAAAAQS